MDFVDGEEVGTITWSAGTQTTSAPLAIGGTIDPPTDEWRLQNPTVLQGG